MIRCLEPPVLCCREPVEVMFSAKNPLLLRRLFSQILSNYLRDNLKTRIPIESIPDHSRPLPYNMVETRPKVSSSWNRPKNQLVAKHQM